MVAVNINVVQVTDGKQGQKVDAKGGIDSSGNFLMALFAAVDGQQVQEGANGDVQLLQGVNAEQRQDAKEEQPTPLDQLMETLMATNIKPEQSNSLVHQVTDLVHEQPKPQLQLQLNNMLSKLQPQQISELKEVLTKVHEQLKSLQHVEQKSLSKLDSLLTTTQNQLPTDLKEVLTTVHSQLKGQQLEIPITKPIDIEFLGKVEPKDLTSLKEVVQRILTQLNEQPGLNNQSTELPKTTLVPQNKLITTEAQLVEQTTVKQDITATSQFAKPVTERPVEQVMQPLAKNNDSVMQTSTQPTVSNQSTESQSFATVMNNKVTGSDAKLDIVQPEQMASRLMGMVKEMVTKQQPNQTTMHLKLNPEHLGEVTIRLSYNRGELNAQFYAATAHGKEALEAALPQMRDALFQQQVKLNEAAVYLNNGSNQWFGGRQGNQGGNRGRGQGGYYNNNSVQPKVGVAHTNGNKAIDDGVNILI